MANAGRDENDVPSKICISAVDGVTIVPLTAKPTTHGLMIDNGTTPTPTVVDSYSETNQNFQSMVNITNGVSKQGNTFTGNGLYLSSAKFYLFKVGSPTGNAYAKIYNITGSVGFNAVPVGNPIAISDPMSVSSLTGSFSLLSFTFSGSNRIQLVNGMTYGVSYEPDDLGATDYTQIGLGFGMTPFAGNLFSYLIASNSWLGALAVNHETIFYVYGSSTVTFPANALRDQNDVPTMLAQSSAGDGTLVPLAATASGALLIQTT